MIKHKRTLNALFLYRQIINVIFLWRSFSPEFITKRQNSSKLRSYHVHRTVSLAWPGIAEEEELQSPDNVGSEFGLL
jgi:hypothetical protein